MPANIYGSGGEWGIYSTPSRDSRLKAAFLETQNRLRKFLALAEQGSDLLEFSGSAEDLRARLSKVLEDAYASCKLSYRNSLDQEVPFTLADVEARLWDLSFDPYHCAELRWGARGAELDSCGDSAIKREWYDAQSNFRAVPHDEETPEGSPVWTLQELRADINLRGRLQGETVDLRAVLAPKSAPF
jgi:hypothetical protein